MPDVSMEIQYLRPDGTLTYEGMTLFQDVFADQDALTTRVETAETDIATIETATSFVKLQASIAAAGQTTLPQTGIPSWANRVNVTLSLISTNGTDDILIQVGDGAYVTTGYVCNYQGFTGAATGRITSTAGILIDTDNAANQHSGTVTFSRQSGNTWVATGIVRRDGSSNGFTVGEITLTGALDRVRLNTTGGTQTFDAGNVSISWE